MRQLSARVDRLEDGFEKRLNALDAKIDSVIGQISALTSSLASFGGSSKAWVTAAMLAVGASGWAALLITHLPK